MNEQLPCVAPKFRVAERSLLNEAGNYVTARVTIFGDGRLEDVLIELTGPNSTSTNAITYREMQALVSAFFFARDGDAGGPAVVETTDVTNELKRVQCAALSAASGEGER